MPSSRGSGFLRPQLRKVIPEVLVLWFRTTTAASCCGLTTSRGGGGGGGLIGAFDEAVELVSGAASAGLEVLAELCGLYTGLCCKI